MVFEHFVTDDREKGGMDKHGHSAVIITWISWLQCTPKPWQPQQVRLNSLNFGTQGLEGINEMNKSVLHRTAHARCVGLSSARSPLCLDVGFAWERCGSVHICVVAPRVPPPRTRKLSWGHSAIPMTTLHQPAHRYHTTTLLKTSSRALQQQPATALF